MRNLLLYILMMFVEVFSSAQTVSNVTATQVGKTIHVSYDLDKEADITLFLSTDGGKTYGKLYLVDGAVGKDVQPGHLTIVWNVLDEMDHFQSDNVIFKVRAELKMPIVTNEPQKTCPGKLTVKDYDGNTYHTVQIGNQCWLKENLRTTHYSDGTEITLGTSKSDRKAYRYYPNSDKRNVNVLGYLYNWKAVVKTSPSLPNNEVQGICPIGWHIPSNSEWGELVDYLSLQSSCLCDGNKKNIAKAIAATSGWCNYYVGCTVGNTQNNNNSSGFFALPAGDYYEQYEDFGTYANFWSSTEEDNLNAWSFSLNYASARVHRNSYYKSYGFSVRCLKD